MPSRTSTHVVASIGEESNCDYCGCPILRGDCVVSADDWNTAACCKTHAIDVAREARTVDRGLTQ